MAAFAGARAVALAAVLLLPRYVAGQSRPVAESLPDWRFVSGGRIRHAPSVGPDGTIYLVSDERLVHALSPRGTEIWRTALEARPAAAPLVTDDGGLRILTEDRVLTALGAQGRRLWTSRLAEAAVFGPALGRQGALYVPLAGGRLDAYDHGGRPQWSFRFKAEIAGPPGVSPRGLIFICTTDRLLHALGSDGRELWSATLPGNGGGVAIGSDGSVYVSSHGVHAFSEGGRPLWSFPISHPTTDPVLFRWPPEAEAETVAVGARNGVLHLTDTVGTRREEITLDGQIEQPPAFRADGALVVTSSRGMLRVFAGRPEEAVALIPTRAAATAPLLGAGGLALVGSEDWVLTATSFGDKPAASSAAGSSWPQSRHDAGQSGRQALPSPSAAYVLLRERAASPSLADKEWTLREIRGHLRGTNYLSLRATEIEEILIRLAGEGSVSPVYVGERQATDYPVVRAEACALLGALGTAAARAALITVVEKEPRTEVQSSAVVGLGVVGYDPDGSSAATLRHLAQRRPWDTGMLLLLVQALAGIARATGPGLGIGEAGPMPETELVSRPAWYTLVSIATGPYPDAVRVSAWAAIRGLTGVPDARDRGGMR